ncbi:META domain-containing protein [Streptomyces geranii]|uniref:META domain-containing protein n=1 Tax=Streptomyces geranii TaxID=2058923 RepID=UPI000D03BB9E|nr:META domain-containing protein [Streptomyces geranii]
MTTQQRAKARRLTSVSLGILTLTVLPLAAACGSEKDGGGSQTIGTGAGTSDVTGVRWTVDDLTLDGKKSEAPSSAWLKIDKNGKVSGNLGCNGFGAQATVDGTEVSFAQFLSTDMACGNDPMTFESNFSKALRDGTLTAKSTETAKSTQQLTLTTRAGATIHLTEEKAAPLYATKWTITTLGATSDSSDTGDSSGTGTDDSQAVSPLPSSADAYLVLDQEKGTVTGKAGCNNVSADATVSDGTITFGSPSTTRRMCDASLMQAEKKLLGLFDGTATYKIDHRTLSLTSANGTTVSATAAD